MVVLVEGGGVNVASCARVQLAEGSVWVVGEQREEAGRRLGV